MNCGLFVTLVFGLAAAGYVNDGNGVEVSIYNCVRMRDSILLLYACFTTFSRLPRICLLAVLLLEYFFYLHRYLCFIDQTSFGVLNWLLYIY